MGFPKSGSRVFRGKLTTRYHTIEYDEAAWMVLPGSGDFQYLDEGLFRSARSLTEIPNLVPFSSSSADLCLDALTHLFILFLSILRRIARY
jgi:hypothetical protein